MFSGTLSSCEFLKLLFLDDWGGRYDLTDRKKKYNRHSRTSSMLAPNTTTALCLLSPFGTALTRTYGKVREIIETSAPSFSAETPKANGW